MPASCRRRPANDGGLGDILSYAFMLVCFVFFAGPLLFLLSMALRTRKEAFLGVARFIPQMPTLDNFVAVLTNASFTLYLWNGLVLSCLSALGVLVVSAPAAYAFSRFRIRGKPVWMMAILAFQMISPLVIMVPLYRYMSWLGLTDTHFGVIMVYIALGVPLGTWLLKGTVDTHPARLDEAAMIDGCDPVRGVLAHHPAAELAGPRIGLHHHRHRRLVAVPRAVPADPDRPAAAGRRSASSTSRDRARPLDAAARRRMPRSRWCRRSSPSSRCSASSSAPDRRRGQGLSPPAQRNPDGPDPCPAT